MSTYKSTKSSVKGNNKSKSSRRGGKIKASTMAIGLIAVFVIIVCAAFVMPNLSASVEDNDNDAQAETFYNQPVDVDIWTIDYEQQAQPRLRRNGVSQQLLKHTAYSTSYNTEYKVPNWCFYELTLSETLGRLPRSNNFQPDPEVKSANSAQLTDYRGSGYDRGHMAPSMDFNWDESIEDESYYLSNMCPQSHAFNSGIWLDLEQQVRRWAERDSAICVACGPVLPVKDKKTNKLINPVTGEDYHITTIGRSKVLVPEYFFKVILSPFGKHPKAIGFLMPHENVQRRDGRGNAPVKDFAVPIDSIEALTGIDFFAILPDDIEDRIEARYLYDDWFKKSSNYRKY